MHPDLVYFRNVDGFGAFTPFAGFEFNLLAFGQRPEPVHRDIGVVHENIIATVVGDDKPVTLFRVKPFDCTGRQWPFLQLGALAGRRCRSPLDDE